MKRSLDQHLPRIRGPFDRVAVQLRTSDESRTHQSFRDECDINKIMLRYEAGQLVEHVNHHQGDYGDYTGAPASYAEALNQVIAADAMFLTLPAKLRDRFANDPGQFLAFCGDRSNEEAMRDLGLLPVEGNKSEAPPQEKRERSDPGAARQSESAAAEPRPEGATPEKGEK